MKPTPIFSEMFNIEREVIVVLSPYPSFEPRSLDVFDVVQRQLSDLRVESVCRVLISDDPQTERKVARLRSAPLRSGAISRFFRLHTFQA
jgi:hypothetical protein